MKSEERQPDSSQSEAICSTGLSLCHCRESTPDPRRARRAATDQGARLFPPPSFARRCLDAVAWIAPGMILILLPKCPACVAAYVALFGVGISITTGSYLRTALIIVCVGALLSLTIKSLRARARHQPSID